MEKPRMVPTQEDGLEQLKAMWVPGSSLTGQQDDGDSERHVEEAGARGGVERVLEF